MNYYTGWGRVFPAYVVFLLDQSASMMNVSLGGGNRAEIVARNIQEAILEIVRMCVHGEEIRDRAFISVIGYGQSNNSAHIIRQGWVSDWADDILIARKNNSCIIPVVAEGCANMNDGFHLAYDMIKEWISFREDEYKINNNYGLGPIIVINITKGTTVNEQDTYDAAQEIMALPNTTLFNIVIPHESFESIDIVYPNSKQIIADICEPNRPEWLFDISSKLPERCVSLAKVLGLDNITEESRGVIVSCEEGSAALLIQSMLPFGNNHSEYR